MTPKDKSIELVNKYLQIYDGRVQQAKQCALIAVNEIDKTIDFDWMEVQNLDREHSYWEQVRVEIINL